jgi:hypothetical protein
VCVSPKKQAKIKMSLKFRYVLQRIKINTSLQALFREQYVLYITLLVLNRNPVHLSNGRILQVPPGLKRLKSEQIENELKVYLKFECDEKPNSSRVKNDNDWNTFFNQSDELSFESYCKTHIKIGVDISCFVRTFTGCTGKVISSLNTCLSIVALLVNHGVSPKHICFVKDGPAVDKFRDGNGGIRVATTRTSDYFEIDMLVCERLKKIVKETWGEEVEYIMSLGEADQQLHQIINECEDGDAAWFIFSLDGDHTLLGRSKKLKALITSCSFGDAMSSLPGECQKLDPRQPRTELNLSQEMYLLICVLCGCDHSLGFATSLAETVISTLENSKEFSSKYNIHDSPILSYELVDAAINALYSNSSKFTIRSNEAKLSIYEGLHYYLHDLIVWNSKTNKVECLSIVDPEKVDWKSFKEANGFETRPHCVKINNLFFPRNRDDAANNSATLQNIRRFVYREDAVVNGVRLPPELFGVSEKPKEFTKGFIEGVHKNITFVHF